MKIEKIQNGTECTIKLTGRLDTVTAPELEGELKEVFASSKSIVMDLENLEYISSAGLRVLLTAQKTMSASEGMKVINVSEEVYEIFDITGFTDILDIK